MDFITAVSCLFMSCHQPASVPYVKAPAVYGSTAPAGTLVTQVQPYDASTDNALWFDTVPHSQPIRDCVHIAFPQCNGGN